MGTKIVYVLLGIFLFGVLNTVFSVFIMLFTGLVLGLRGEPFVTIQSWGIAGLAAATSVVLIYTIWPRNPKPPHADNRSETSAN